MPTKDEWSRAFAKQARADFDTYNALRTHLTQEGRRLVPECQKLHFLQMACEKLAKAHLLKATAQLKDLEKSHAYVEKALPTIVRDQMLLNGENEHVAKGVGKKCKEIGRAIDLLSPAVKAGGKRRDNCEYPWEHGGILYVPAEWPFSNFNLLTEPGGRNILKRVREAIERLAQ